MKSTDRLDSICIRLEEVRDILKKLDKTKSTGPNMISPYILNKCSDTLAYPIWKIMQKSLDKELLQNGKKPISDQCIKRETNRYQITTAQ